MVLDSPDTSRSTRTRLGRFGVFLAAAAVACSLGCSNASPASSERSTDNAAIDNAAVQGAQRTLPSADAMGPFLFVDFEHVSPGFIEPGKSYTINNVVAVPRDQFQAAVFLEHSPEMQALFWQ